MLALTQPVPFYTHLIIDSLYKRGSHKLGAALLFEPFIKIALYALTNGTTACSI